MSRSVLARASRVFVGASVMSLTVQLMYMSRQSWDFGTVLAGLPPLNRTWTSSRGKHGREPAHALETLQLSAKQAAYKSCDTPKICEAINYLPLRSVDDTLRFLRDLSASPTFQCHFPVQY
jgi:hypothetical protein